MNKVNRKQYWNISKVLNMILIFILLIIVVTMVYSFFEPKFVLMYNKRDIVSDVKTIEDLNECANKYYDALIYEKTYVVQEMQTIFNKKSTDEIQKIKEKYGDNLSYNLIVKQAYKLRDGLYLCNLEIVPEIDEDIYDWDNMKTAEVIIKLNRNNYTFKIYHDKFNLN